MFSMFRGSTTSLGKAAFMVTTTAADMSVAGFITHRVTDTITGTCEFSEYTRRQCQKYPISGMHPPFITENEQARSQFHQHFSEFSYLLPGSVEALQQQQALISSVKISPLKECPVTLSSDPACIG